MKKYDMKLTEENLVDSIKKDYLGRNKKLSKLIDILNSLSSNVVISIDGNWGTGKTIFVKQLELINKKEDLNVLNKDSIKNLKQIIVCFIIMLGKMICMIHHYYQ